MHAVTLRTLIFLAISFIWCIAPGTILGASYRDMPHTAEELLERLDSAIDERDTYIMRRTSEIDSMVMNLSSSPFERTAGYIDIAKKYKSLCADSAIIYLRRASADAYSLSDSVLIFRSRMALAAILPLVDLEREAILIFESVDAEELPSEWKREYYDGAADMYTIISDRAMALPVLSEKYGAKADSYRQHAMRYYPPESPEWLFHEACRFYFDGNCSAAMISGNELLERTDITDALYGRGAELMARISASLGNDEDEFYYTLHGALSETLRGDREGMSLQRLGHLLYNRGDIDRAHSYLSVALTNASYGMGYHSDLVGESLMIIDKAYRSQWSRNYMLLWVITGMMVLLLLVMTVMLLRYRRYIKNMRKEHDIVLRLQDDRRLYLANFLRVCSISMRRISELSRTVKRKLAARQFEELFNIIKSGNYIDEQRRDMFGIFDSTFLKIYPTFVDDLNTILRPDEQYVIPADGRLMPELRIAALTRIGLTDTARMAEFLGYSPNTIYAYRAKIRAKAIDSSTFDRDFQALSTRV